MSDMDLYVDEIVQSMAMCFLGIDARRMRMAPPALDDLVTGRVTIRGQWNGDLTFGCSSTFLRRVASRMLGLPPGDVSEEDERDVIGELTNVVGGNLKSLVGSQSDPCQLSLPFVATGRTLSASSRATHQCWFTLGGDVVCVAVVEGDRPSAMPVTAGAHDESPGR